MILGFFMITVVFMVIQNVCSNEHRNHGLMLSVILMTLPALLPVNAIGPLTR